MHGHAHGFMKADTQRFVKAMRQISEVEIPHMELSLAVWLDPPPEVVVAGIEGRAIVRSLMQRELRYIGEVA